MIDSFRGNYRWLSNFHEIPVQLDGVWYPSVEHAYQAAKTLDLEKRKAFQYQDRTKGLTTLTAGQAKRLGTPLNGERPDWYQVNLGIMKDLCRQKFRTEASGLQGRLLATGDDELVEGNNWGDTFWGKVNGVGENHLGRILMEIRAELKGPSR